jgi:hypothetical protein
MRVTEHPWNIHRLRRQGLRKLCLQQAAPDVSTESWEVHFGRYTELTADRFKSFWKEKIGPLEAARAIVITVTDDLHSDGHPALAGGLNMVDSPTSGTSSDKTVSTKGNSTGLRKPPAPARRQLPRVPDPKPASKRSLAAWYRRAQILINCATGVWSRREIAELTTLRVHVRNALRTLPPRHKKRATKFLHMLNRINRTLQSGNTKKSRDRGDPARHEHPDRNRITDYNSAGSRIQWATPKR